MMPTNVPEPIAFRSLPLLALGLLLLAGHAGAASVRDEEITECRAGEIATWGDGQDRPAVSSPLVFTYHHDGAPAWIAPAQVTERIDRALAAWAACGVPARRVPWSPYPDVRRGLVVVQWGERTSGGNFGLANLAERTLSLGPAAFELLRSRNPAHDAGSTLQLVISHEMGHLFGLMAHSRRCVDVLSYYGNSRGESCFKRDGPASKVAEYRHELPTACDIQRCRRANGKEPLQP
jgi:hypothetical protein